MIYEMAEVVSSKSSGRRIIIASWFIDLICKEFSIQNFGILFKENTDNSWLLGEALNMLHCLN